MTKLLVSVRDVAEARIALASGVDLIDLKSNLPMVALEPFSQHKKYQERPSISWAGLAAENLLITQSLGGAIAAWKVPECEALWVIQGHGDQPVALDAERTTLVVPTASGVHLVDVRTGESVWTLQDHLHWVRAAGFSPDGKRLATGSRDGVLKLWDLTTGVALLSLTTQTDGVTSATFSPDGKKLYAGGSDGQNVR